MKRRTFIAAALVPLAACSRSQKDGSKGTGEAAGPVPVDQPVDPKFDGCTG